MFVPKPATLADVYYRTLLKEHVYVRVAIIVHVCVSIKAMLESKFYVRIYNILHLTCPLQAETNPNWFNDQCSTSPLTRTGTHTLKQCVVHYQTPYVHCSFQTLSWPHLQRGNECTMYNIIHAELVWYSIAQLVTLHRLQECHGVKCHYYLLWM